MIPPEKRRQLKAILFDKDGTLLDFHATWSPILRNVALDLAEGDEAEAMRLLEVGGFDRASGRIASGSALAAGNTRDIVSLWYPQAGGARHRTLVERVDALFHAGAVSGSVASAGLAEALNNLAEAGYALGIATSDSAATARAGVTALGIGDRFACILGYDSVRRPKPAPDMVLAFCEAVSVTPSEVAVVGDSLHDLAMARAAGAGAAVGILGGTSTRDSLAPHADAVIENLAGLPQWLCHQGFMNREQT